MLSDSSTFWTWVERVVLVLASLAVIIEFLTDRDFI